MQHTSPDELPSGHSSPLHSPPQPPPSSAVSLPDEFIKGLWRENPIFVQVLGMCPTLAVTNSARNAIAMGLATLFVLLMSNGLVSLLRHWIPAPVRIASYVLIIATFVTIVDYGIQAIDLRLHQALGAFISLIVVNCLILARAEAFAARHQLPAALADALGMGLGFTLALLSLGAIRELLGSGSLFGVALLPPTFQTWSVMLMPSGGFFTLAGCVILINAVRSRRMRRRV